jgi:hypothetical protein
MNKHGRSTSLSQRRRRRRNRQPPLIKLAATVCWRRWRTSPLASSFIPAILVIGRRSVIIVGMVVVILVPRHFVLPLPKVAAIVVALPTAAAVVFVRVVGVAVAVVVAWRRR